MRIAYKTALGRLVLGKAEDVLQARRYADDLDKKVDLIFTSPPFPLNRKKKYGNEQGEAYVNWLAGFAPLFKKLLRPEGSIVLEMGNAWEPGRPVMSTLALKALLAFLERGGFTLCQQFVWYNPARLPSPAQWVNVERIRLKDAYTHLWWMALTDRPHADNRQVLKKYSSAMEQLLARQSYNTGKRPSEHHIGEKSFLKNNVGAIPSNLITLANTQASSDYLNYCRAHKMQPHPARMPSGLAEFFIKFLTKPKAQVLDPFAGSNTTGAAAEKLGRKWLAIEPEESYLLGSRGRFNGLAQKVWDANNRERNREANRRYRLKAHDRLLERARARREQNREQVREYNRNYVESNKDKLRAYWRRYYVTHVEEIKAYQARTRDRIREMQRARVLKNIDRVRLRRRAYNHRAYQLFKGNLKKQLAHGIRRRLRVALTKHRKSELVRIPKKGSAVKLLGCTIAEVIQHLEAQFKPGMSWENWSVHGWHIDHIQSLSSFDLTDPMQLAKSMSLH
jgi:DNA modification methylase